MFEGDVDGGSWMLHAMNKGMKSVCASERLRSLCRDQMRRDGNVHRYRPNRSPMLKRRTWSAWKRSGWNEGEMGWMAVVIGGNTDFNKSSVGRSECSQLMGLQA